MFWPAFICAFASYATDQIISTADVVYNSNWREYPLDLQKYFILIIARAQHPFFFNGLTLVHCTLEVFGKVGIDFYYLNFEVYIFTSFSFKDEISL